RRRMVLGGSSLPSCETDLSVTTAEELDPRPKRFAAEDDILLALESKQIGLQAPIEYRRDGEVILTTPGRVIFNEEGMRALQDALGERFEGKADFINRTLGKKEMNDFVSSLVDVFGVSSISVVLDTIKELGFHYATQAGITISKNDIVIPESKELILEDYEGRVGALEAQYERGLITEEERKDSIVTVWTEATDTVAAARVG